MQRMLRIRQTKMQQGVGHQQMPEFVVDSGRWYGMSGKHRKAERHRKQGQQQHAPTGPGRQFARERLNPRARHDCHRNQKRGEGEFDKVAGAEANRILGRHEGLFSQSPRDWETRRLNGG